MGGHLNLGNKIWQRGMDSVDNNILFLKEIQLKNTIYSAWVLNMGSKKSRTFETNIDNKKYFTKRVIYEWYNPKLAPTL